MRPGAAPLNVRPTRPVVRTLVFVLASLLFVGCGEATDAPAQTAPDAAIDTRVEHDGGQGDGHEDSALDVPAPGQDYPQKLSETGLYKDIMKGKNMQQNIELHAGDTIAVP